MYSLCTAELSSTCQCKRNLCQKKAVSKTLILNLDTRVLMFLHVHVFYSGTHDLTPSGLVKFNNEVVWRIRTSTPITLFDLFTQAFRAVVITNLDISYYCVVCTGARTFIPCAVPLGDSKLFISRSCPILVLTTALGWVARVTLMLKTLLKIIRGQLRTFWENAIQKYLNFSHSFF